MVVNYYMAKQQNPPSNVTPAQFQRQVDRVIDEAWRAAKSAPAPEEPPLPSEILGTWQQLLEQTAALQKEAQARVDHAQELMKKFQEK